MESATVTSKGQITIPMEVRKRFNISVGDRIQFLEGDSGRIELVPCKEPLSSLVGILPKPAEAVSVEEMNETIRKGWAGLL